VAGIAGEGRKMIEESRAGICTEPEDSVALQKAIIELFESKDLREKYGASGRRYAEENFSRQKIAKQYLKAMMSLKDNGNGYNGF
jgi:glycosyltransferase involved in cell wall biosynthesis